MAVCIRAIAASEYDAAAQLIAATFRDCVAASMTPRGIRTFLDYATAEAIRSRDASGCASYVALLENRLVGVLHVRNAEHISLLFVLPEYQGRGIGHALIRAADESKPLATVNSSTNAVRAYERCGFRVSGPEQVVDGIRHVPMRRQAA